MFSFASILAMVEEAIAIGPTIAADVTAAVTDVKNVLNSPDVKALEAGFNALVGTTKTIGSAIVVEPKATAPAALKLVVNNA